MTRRFSIDNKLNALKIYDNRYLKINKRDFKIFKNDLIQTTRIGISKAKDLRWRWYLKSSDSISKKEKVNRKIIFNNKFKKLSRKS